MVTVADFFLADVYELSDNEDDILDEDNVEADNIEEDVDGELADIEAFNYDDLDNVSKLQITQRYIDIMQSVTPTLDSAKKKILDFVEGRMGCIAPNLSAIVGSAVAAKLMGTAGGLSALAKMPACNVQLLGAKRKNLAGFSSATSQFRVGYIEQTEIFQSTPPALRMRAGRLLASKSTLAARVDSTGGDETGGVGRAFREEIREKIDKWQEPPPAKQPKPLPVL
ncbi:U4/U6 small nuclear ribonucleoprotein Prp31 homolog [Apium graveolens]|uniref:U4/U6 small nuclear ribonucleoprotein Prp31 homolog n=1 Tax=Apium graveolens TaxID=4045 RepID=UPI003D78B8C0